MPAVPSRGRGELEHRGAREILQCGSARAVLSVSHAEVSSRRDARLVHRSLDPAPCFSTRTSLTRPPLNRSRPPPGQRTSIASYRVRSPSPKCNRESFWEMKLDPP